MSDQEIENTETIESMSDFMNDTNVDNSIEQEVEQDEIIAESVPAEEESIDKVEKEVESSKGFQKRVDKLTKQKYDEKARADKLQAQLDAIEAEKNKLTKPTLEDYSFDEDEYNKANHAYISQQAVNDYQQTQAEASKLAADQAEQTAKQEVFNAQVEALGKADFMEVANSIPELPEGIAMALMSDDNGAALIYQIGNDIELANRLATMTPAQAFMTIGRLDVNNVGEKKQVKVSSAPAPVKGIKASGSSTPKDIDKMTMAEFMAL